MKPKPKPDKKKSPRLLTLSGVAGLDEAGRGPLAGPVYAAAVILPKGLRLKGLNDSKKVDPETREKLAIEIKKHSIWAVAFADVEEIDRMNILWASMAAMCRALKALPELPVSAIVDGNIVPPGLPCPAKTAVGGDGRYACIAAASILAKTERDRFMSELSSEYPNYGFDHHFGYSTPQHKAALLEFGPCPYHRRSFAPCRESDQLCLTFVE
jgi:ribonuclease HII